MLIINIENSLSHLKPHKHITDCIIDLKETTKEARLVLRTVLLNNAQVYTKDSFSDIWNNLDAYIESYCHNYSGTWNITGLKPNIALKDFIQLYNK